MTAIDDNYLQINFEEGNGVVEDKIDPKFSACGRFKIEPDIDLGVTVFGGVEQCQNISNNIDRSKKTFLKEVYNDDTLSTYSNDSEKSYDSVGDVSQEDVCEYFGSIPLKKRHRNTVARKDFVCTICLYTTDRTDHMKLHNTTHSNVRPFKCPLCCYRSKRAFTLQEHLRIHSDEKPFACSFCDFRTKKKYNLDEHMRRSHATPEEKEAGRPYMCMICGHRSIRASHLKVHMKLHSDYRPFKCTLCNYAAKRSGHLKSHMGSVHCDNGERKRKRRQLNDGSINRRSRKYDCYKCPYKTDNRYIMKSHLKFNHSFC